MNPCAPAELPQVHNPKRLFELRRMALLDQPPERAIDRLVRMTARLLKTPVALMSLVDEARQFFFSQVGLPEPWSSTRQTPLTHSFCKHVVERRDKLVVRDARLDPLVCDNLAIAELGVIAYLGIPMVTKSGYVLGSYCVIDGKPRDWSDEEIELLTDLTASLMSELELRDLLAESARRERELIEARVAAEAGVRAKNQFLAIVSHELRTPLTAILGNCDILLDRNDPVIDPQLQRDLIQTIQRNGFRLMSQVGSILELTRMDTLENDLKLVPTSIHTLTRTALAEPMREAEERGLTFRFDSTLQDLPPLLMDESAYLQIVQHLAGNAVKFTDHGEVRVALSLEQEPIAPDRPQDGSDDISVHHVLKLVVEDDGGGFVPPVGMSVREVVTQRGTEYVVELVNAQGDLELIGPFNPGDPLLNRTRGGLGIGLALTQRLVKAMSGSLQLQFRPGVGTRATLRLPVTFARSGSPASAPAPLALTQTQTSTYPQLASSKQPTPEEVRPGRRPQSPVVLMGEDSEDIGMLVELYLRRAHIELELAHDLDELDKRARAGRHRAILIDLRLLKNRSPSWLDDLRRCGVTCPIVALDAVGDGERHGIDLSRFDGVISRPAGRTDFLKKLKSFLTKPSAVDEP